MKIICFGDSNTYGYDTETNGRFPRDARWTGVLAQEIGAGHEVIEEGLCGRTSVFQDPLTEGLSSLDYITPCLMTHSPVDLLIVMLGTNDVKERFSATPRNITGGFARLLLKAQQTPAWSTKGPQILVVAPPPIKPLYIQGVFAGEMGDGCSQKTHLLPELYQEMAQTNGYSFLNGGDFAEMRDLDGMHMDAANHAKLGRAVAKKVCELLEKGVLID